MSKLHQLQKYEARDFKGQMLFEQTLYELLMIEPRILMPNLVNLWGVDPDMELYKFYQSIPELSVEAGANEMAHWRVQGKAGQNAVLKDIEDTAGNSLLAGTLTASVSVAEPLFARFDKALWSHTLQIKNETGNYQFIVDKVGEDAQGTVYTLNTVYTDPTARIPLDEIALNTRWSAVGMAQPEHFSYRGINGWMTSTYEMATRMSKGRFEYQVSKEMINFGKTLPLKMPFYVPDMKAGGIKQIDAYINALDFAAISFFEVMKAKASLYSKKNWTVDGKIYGIDANGFKVPTTYGLFESIAPGNSQEYNSFDLDMMTDFIFAKHIQKRSRTNRKVKLVTGEWGARIFSQAVQAKTNSSSPNILATLYQQAGNASNTGTPNAIKYGFQNTGYITECNGLEFEVVIADWLDDTQFFPKMHPSGLGNAESHTFYIMSDGSDKPSNGIYRMRPKGSKMEVGVINGLGSPYTTATDGGRGVISSKVSGYEVHGEDYFGCVATDPDALLEFRLAARS